VFLLVAFFLVAGGRRWPSARRSEGTMSAVIA